MAGLSEYISHLYTMSIVFFTVLLLELVILVRSLTGGILSSNDHHHPIITTTQYLKIIDEKNPVSLYKDGLRLESIECAVCLSLFEEGDEIRKLRCNHTFHKDCLDTWLQQEWATCPLCRTKVLPEEIVVKYRQQEGSHHEYDGSDEELIFLLSALHALTGCNGVEGAPYKNDYQDVDFTPNEFIAGDYASEDYYEDDYGFAS